MPHIRTLDGHLDQIQAPSTTPGAFQDQGSCLDQGTEGEGFEPSSGEAPKAAFKAAAFNRSATPPG